MVQLPHIQQNVMHNIHSVTRESPESRVSDQFVLMVHNRGDPGSNLIQAKIIHCLASCRPSLAFLSTKVVQNNINVIIILVGGLCRPTVPTYIINE